MQESSYCDVMLLRVFGLLLGCFGFYVVVGSLWEFFFLCLLFFSFSVFPSFCILLVTKKKKKNSREDNFTRILQ